MINRNFKNEKEIQKGLLRTRQSGKNNNNNNTRDLDRRSLEDLGEKAVSRR